MTVLGWVAEAERAALYNSLSYELKEALSRTLSTADETLTEYVGRVKRLDDLIRRFAAECKPPGGRGQPGGQSGQSSNRGPRSRIPHSNNPADSTGATPHLGSAPMDFAAKQRLEARQGELNKWTAEGRCTMCGSDQHWRRNCPRNANRPPMAASATVQGAASSTGSTPFATGPPTPAASVTAESGKE